MSLDNHMNVFAVVLSRECAPAPLLAAGVLLYGCWPMTDSFNKSDCTHWLAVAAVPFHVKSEDAFNLFADYGVFSYQWLTYYERVDYVR